MIVHTEKSTIKAGDTVQPVLLVPLFLLSLQIRIYLLLGCIFLPPNLRLLSKLSTGRFCRLRLDILPPCLCRRRLALRVVHLGFQLGDLLLQILALLLCSGDQRVGQFEFSLGNSMTVFLLGQTFGRLERTDVQNA